MNAIGRVRDAQMILKELLKMLQDGEVRLTAVDRKHLTTHLQQALAKPVKAVDNNAQARKWADAYIEAIHAMPTLTTHFIKPTFTLRTQQEETAVDPMWVTEAHQLTQLADQLIHQLDHS